MPLDYSSGYQSVKPLNIPQSVSDPFASALESINKKKEEATKRQQQLIASREAFSKDNYYGSHADLLIQASEQLMEREDDFAVDDASAQKYKQAWAQISELSDLFETFKETTYGSPSDEPGGNTFIAAEKRSAGVDPFYSEGYQATVGYNQMKEALGGLNSPMYEVSFDDDLNLLVNGQSLAEVDFGTSANPFDPVLTPADISGAAAFEGLWNGSKELTGEGIERKMMVHLEDPDNLSRAIRHYINSSKETNPSYNRSVEDVATDPDELQQAIDLYIKEAKDHYNALYTEKKKPSASEEADKKKRESLLSDKMSGSVSYIEGYNEAGDPIMSTSNAVGMVSISLGTIYVGDDYGMYLIDSKENRHDIGVGTSNTTKRSLVQKALRSEAGGMTLNQLYDKLSE